MLGVPMLQVVDGGREIEGVMHDVVEADGAGLDVVLMLVVDVDIVLEKLDVELVEEVVEVDGLQVDVEPVHVDDNVVPEDDAEVKLPVVLLLLVVDGALQMCDLRWLRKTRWTACWSH